MSNDINEILSKRIMVLDGAMGTMLQKQRLGEDDYRGHLFKHHDKPLKGCNEVLNLSREDLIANIHASYLEAGADIIETNTFGATSLSLDGYGLQDHAYSISRKGAEIARKCADRFSASGVRRFVAGSMGPGSKSLSIPDKVDCPASRAISFDTMKKAYAQQTAALIDGDCDLLLMETVFDTLNAKACLFAIREVFEQKAVKLPVMISLSINDASGRILSGQDMDAFMVSVEHFPFLAVGINCAMGASEIRPFLADLAGKAPIYVSVHPNAGMPDEEGGYNESPTQMAEIIGEYAKEEFVNIIGGCCGTTPEHIKQIKEAVDGKRPRQPKQAELKTSLSGLEALVVKSENNFVNIGERTNVAGSRRFARLIRDKDYDAALSVARQQVENGAQIIDINLDDGLLDARDEMENFLRLLGSEPDIARVPFMPDSSGWDVIEGALKNIQGKALVNSISLGEGETIFIHKAKRIRTYGAAMVVMAFDEKGQATDYDRKIIICKRAYDLLVKEAGIPPGDIVFDCNILTIGTGMEEHSNYAKDFIAAVRWIKLNLPGVKTSGGISNLSFAFRGNTPLREALHSVFLYHAIHAGLDMGIVNAGTLPLYDKIDPGLRERCEDLIFNRRRDATERLMELGAGFLSEKAGKTAKSEAVVYVPAAKRLEDALVRGVADGIEAELTACLNEMPRALEIIEGPLMSGMNKVGELFRQGKMFLPQVIKSARVMKRAVAFLYPLLSSQRSGNGKRTYSGTVLLATVKGDVHDIGKNIVSLVLSCNNFRIIDLGIMVDREKIIAEAVRQNADIIGLSGLISPSLEEMAAVAAGMEKQRLKIPLLIGGATTSETHTALKIDTLYSGPVIHVKDASEAVFLSAQLIDKESRERVYSAYKAKYQKIRSIQKERKARGRPLPLSIARKNRFLWEAVAESKVKPPFTGIREVRPGIGYLKEYIDWKAFYRQWRVYKTQGGKENNRVAEKESERLRNDALELLGLVEKEKLLDIRGEYGFFRAWSENEDVVVLLPGGDTRRLHFLRDCAPRPEGIHNLCFADFIAPENACFSDYIGLFAVSAGFGADEAEKAFMARNDDYSALLLRTLADRLAETFAECLHGMINMGIRPAPGYPACPDHSEKATIFSLLDAEKRSGVQLTEAYLIKPAASVCGYYFLHPQARYFSIGAIGQDQLISYAEAKNRSIEEIQSLLSHTLNQER